MKRCITICMCLLAVAGIAQTWKPAGKKIMTRWAADVSPDRVLPEYPRPQMVRQQWQNLNGLWQYRITDTHQPMPQEFVGQILVPFSIESALSGVGRTVHDRQLLWYRRSFTVPGDWDGQRILLHFGAVDWECHVFVNGIEVGSHNGGYDAFSFDITDALKPGDKNTLTLSVWDPGSEGSQPRGKQVTQPGGIWYTAVTGIWQTVWLEPVPVSRISTFKAVPDIDRSCLTVQICGIGIEKDDRLRLTAINDGRSVAVQESSALNPVQLELKKVRLWSPESPYLYDLKLELLREGKVIDTIDSYFGMRKISMEAGSDGIPRLCLNNKPYFQLGTLDQGWWPDGLYTAPTDEALAFDIIQTKAYGFNTIRKHVKVEPARWYYHADKLGMLVWQDMPSGDMRGSRSATKERERRAQSIYQYQKEHRAMMDGLINAPSIVIWVPFNEGWGQFNTVEILNWVKHYDPSRLVDGPSGWYDFTAAGDIQDMHSYPGPDAPAYKNDNRALVLGEFGGLGLPVSGHTWQDEKNWGYRSYQDQEALLEAYLKLIEKIPALIEKGLSAAIYTQTTDVEIEVNGLMTYDRAIFKMDVDAVARANEALWK